MAQSNADLSKKLVAQGATMVPAALQAEVRGWYKANRSTLMALCSGDQKRVGLFIAAAFSQINNVPKLLECNRNSLYDCMIHSMSLGLLPGAMKECAYIPFGGTAVFVPMVEGIVKLIHETGYVRKLTYDVVVESDEFDYVKGDEERLLHRPSFLPYNKRGERLGAYCIVELTTGGKQVTYRPAHFIEDIKARSAGAKKSDSPWNSKHPGDVDAMWCKTVIKQAAKALPKTPSLGKAIALDNKVENPELQKDAQMVNDEIGSVIASVIEDDVPQAEERTPE